VEAQAEMRGVGRECRFRWWKYQGKKMVVTKDVTTYHLLDAKHVLLSEAAAKKLSEALS